MFVWYICLFNFQYFLDCRSRSSWSFDPSTTLVGQSCYWRSSSYCSRFQSTWSRHYGEGNNEDKEEFPFFNFSFFLSERICNVWFCFFSHHVELMRDSSLAGSSSDTWLLVDTSALLPLDLLLGGSCTALMDLKWTTGNWYYIVTLTLEHPREQICPFLKLKWSWKIQFTFFHYHLW